MKKFLRGTVAAGIGMAAGISLAEKVLAKPMVKNQNNAEKFQALFLMMGHWVQLKQQGINLSKFLEENNYKKVAIYGMSLSGQALYDELDHTGIEVVYTIDRDKNSVTSKVELYSPDEKLPEADAIIVTAISYFNEIATMLEKKVECPIISLEDIVFNV